jgi:hypothetical protein
VRFQPIPPIEAQFGRWPRDASFARARELGVVGDDSIDAIVREHLESPSS